MRRDPDRDPGRAAAALQALATLGRGEEGDGVGILAEIFDAAGAHRLVDVLEEPGHEAGG